MSLGNQIYNNIGTVEWKIMSTISEMVVYLSEMISQSITITVLNRVKQAVAYA